jgi:hypothetical protein
VCILVILNVGLFKHKEEENLRHFCGETDPEAEPKAKTNEIHVTN